ncbi:MAG: hypothetical protein KIT31_35000 [Deltaproteobacteria bacterium]|nr:hypothetical protein [Deltaproteobacteria bacterium]
MTIHEVALRSAAVARRRASTSAARIEDGPRLPRDTAVPAWIGAAIARGLSPDPAARFPTTGDLLAALAHPPSRLGRWCAAGGLALAAASALALHLSTRGR